MGFAFTLTNPDAVAGLPPGKYQTRIVSATWDEIKVEYAGRPYDPDNPCLMPITVHDEAYRNMSEEEQA